MMYDKHVVRGNTYAAIVATSKEYIENEKYESSALKSGLNKSRRV